MVRRIVFVSMLMVAIAFLLSGCQSNPDKSEDSGNIYYTSGVHNTEGCDTEPGNCIARRLPGEPADPAYPQWWSSEWTMFRVFQNYANNMPPYSNPPDTLSPDDYQVSYGATYYDSSYIPKDGDGTGAMMEHYDKFCLPIFPLNNNYTCSFVSLGNKAYFLTYKVDRPKDMPPCCFFSPMNHPPRRDFIKHLPYNAEYSTHLNNSIQAYAKWVESEQGNILFGYAFYKTPEKDSYDPSAEPYRHPQSFYFSGYPLPPADAPIVSQNYTNFRMEKPDPAKTWDQVAAMCPADPPDCQLFDPPANNAMMRSEQKVKKWSTLRP